MGRGFWLMKAGFGKRMAQVAKSWQWQWDQQLVGPTNMAPISQIFADDLSFARRPQSQILANISNSVVCSRYSFVDLIVLTQVTDSDTRIRIPYFQHSCNWTQYSNLSRSILWLFFLLVPELHFLILFILPFNATGAS